MPDERWITIESDLPLNEGDGDPIAVMSEWVDQVAVKWGRRPDRLRLHSNTAAVMVDQPAVKKRLAIRQWPGDEWVTQWIASVTDVWPVTIDQTLYRGLIVAELDDGPGVHRAELIFKGYRKQD